MKNLIVILVLLAILTFIFSTSILTQADMNSTRISRQDSLTSDQISEISTLVEKNMKDGKIPGVSIVIVSGDKTIFSEGFGYSDITTRKQVTPETLFELGSNSKALTALGILKLEKDGLINLNDPVSKYIPWFRMKYAGEHRGKKIDDYVDITLEQLLHHTSGIPFKSIGDIPITSDEDALEQTVRTQVEKELDFYPGEKFLYATINYDLLGLVIKKVSGTSFEQYMRMNVLEPLELNNTYLFRNEAAKKDLAKGYKLKYLRPTEYEAPIYRGNTPAGYFITNGVDLAKWLKIQLGTQLLVGFDDDLITVSHKPDRKVAPFIDGSSYAYGWSIFQDGGGIISHGGNNPNYSSFIVFRPEEKLAVAVLANMNSSYTKAIGQGIFDLIELKEPITAESDLYKSLDGISFAVTCIGIPTIVISIFFLIAVIIQIFKRERKFVGVNFKSLAFTFFLLLFLFIFGYCLYNLPDILFFGLPWAFVDVWAPQSLILSLFILIILVIAFSLYFLIETLFNKDNRKPIFTIIIFSLTSGLGNALIIFVVNEVLNRTDRFQYGLMLFFILGLIFYVYGQRLVRVMLVNLTNEIIYLKRVELTKKILNVSYQKFEAIEDGKLYAGLNNDTEVIGNFANTVISATTSLVTLLCCFIYLGVINIYGLLVSLIVISFAAGLYFIVGKYANKLWEQTRDYQNKFFKFINDLIGGFKELNLHNNKRIEFEDDMQKSCLQYKKKSIEGDLSFANVFIIGELLFTFVIGVVSFLFPIIFKDIDNNILRSYIFVFLYMAGPVNGVLNAIPSFIRIRISWNRLNALIKQLEQSEENIEEIAFCENKEKGSYELKLENVRFSYSNNNTDIFSVGPLNCIFKTGEVTFITGGNGSGKSTLAKLITGLYKPDFGQVVLNGEPLSNEKLRNLFSTVFSDFHLFEKLYGINYINKTDDIDSYLKTLQIEDKLSISDGVLSTIKLSTGQRKRLALLVSFLENREFYVFDEWAADQDPEFREYFYKVILPELKRKNKCIIAITHDDRYFNTADKIYKMEMGKIIF